MMTIAILKFLVVGLIVGSMFYGILSLAFFCWIIPERHWPKVWLICVTLTYISYGEEFLKQYQRDREKQSNAISERYEQITAEK